jgi:hypothetical protein
LNKIAVVNWVSTTHSYDVATGMGKFIYAIGSKTPFDFGLYIFYQTIQHAKSLAVKMPIAFPRLLCGIILSQHPDILGSSDVSCKRDPALTLDLRSLQGPHVADIGATSIQKPSTPLTRK